MPILVNDQILGLQIPMNDAKFVKVLNRKYYFSQVEFGPILLEVDLIVQHLSQVSSREVLEHEHVALSFGEGKGSHHQVVSSYLLKDLVLIFYCFQLLLSVIFRNTDYFESVDVLCLRTTHHVNLSEGSLP